MSVPAYLLVHSATIEPYEGSGAYGDQYGTPYELPCYHEGRRQFVRASDGTEAVSEGTLYANVADIPAGSRVQILNRETWVITVTTLDDGGLTGLAHIEVALA